MSLKTHNLSNLKLALQTRQPQNELLNAVASRYSRQHQRSGKSAPCTLVLVSSAILRLKLENGLIQQRSADDEEKAEGLRILEISPLKNAYTPTMSSDKALDLQPSSE
jgi:hypothetical protein